ncbi:hypothetical protein [Butyrivibrio sp. WCE2006]|uniref:hypothetical protein n=1 Tax=Butyrivibrio sp. WCE2006 TaxID=1410611 RepID=UPI0005D14C2E|nr:hypothetical protein [Butyrivibrio sp. WCE2006]
MRKTNLLILLDFETWLFKIFPQWILILILFLMALPTFVEEYDALVLCNATTDGKATSNNAYTYVVEGKEYTGYVQPLMTIRSGKTTLVKYIKNKPEVSVWRAAGYRIFNLVMGMFCFLGGVFGIFLIHSIEADEVKAARKRIRKQNKKRQELERNSL